MELCLGGVLTHMNLTSRHSARISQWKLKGSITSCFWKGKEKIFNLKLEENISSLTKSALRRRYFTRCQIYPLVCFMLLWKSPWPKQIVEKRVYFFSYMLWFITEKSQKRNSQQKLLGKEQKQRPLGEAVSLLCFKTHVQLLCSCIPIKPAWGWHCPQLPKPSTITLLSRKCPTDLPTGKSDIGHPSA